MTQALGRRKPLGVRLEFHDERERARPSERISEPLIRRRRHSRNPRLRVLEVEVDRVEGAASWAPAWRADAMIYLRVLC